RIDYPAVNFLFLVFLAADVRVFDPSTTNHLPEIRIGSFQFGNSDSRVDLLRDQETTAAYITASLSRYHFIVCHKLVCATYRRSRRMEPLPSPARDRRSVNACRPCATDYPHFL